MMKKISLSALIIVKNEESKIEDCLKSISWCDEIIVVDTGSTDKTGQISEKYTDKIYSSRSGGFSDWRNTALSKASGEWVLYIDADERCTPELKSEVLKVINSENKNSMFVIPRTNIILGRKMVHGGWWPDYVKRLFKRTDLIKWSGELHEEPVYKGDFGYLKNPLIHLKHSSTREMLEKTNKWSTIEAKLMHRANHPPMNIFRFLSAMLRELWKRLVVQKGFLDGPEGVIYAIYQMYSRFVSYAKLWEMQKHL